MAILNPFSFLVPTQRTFALGRRRLAPARRMRGAPVLPQQTFAHREKVPEGRMRGIAQQFKKPVDREASGPLIRLLRRHLPASSQALYRSLPADAESSLTPLLLLSPSDPLRWALPGGLGEGFRLRAGRETGKAVPSAPQMWEKGPP
jgi:hypothetical protein